MRYQVKSILTLFSKCNALREREKNRLLQIRAAKLHRNTDACILKLEFSLMVKTLKTMVKLSINGAQSSTFRAETVLYKNARRCLREKAEC